MSIVVIQYSDKGIRFLSDSRSFEEVDGKPTVRYSDEAKKVFRLEGSEALFSAAGKIAMPVEKYFPKMVVKTATDGESFLIQWSTASCATFTAESARTFQAEKGLIHSAFVGGKDGQNYWLRLLQVTYEGGEFKHHLRSPAWGGPTPLLTSAGGRKVALDVYGDPRKHIEQVIAVSPDCGGPIQEVCI